MSSYFIALIALTFKFVIAIIFMLQAAKRSWKHGEHRTI